MTGRYGKSCAGGAHGLDLSSSPRRATDDHVSGRSLYQFIDIIRRDMYHGRGARCRHAAAERKNVLARSCADHTAIHAFRICQRPLDVRMDPTCRKLCSPSLRPRLAVRFDCRDVGIAGEWSNRQMTDRLEFRYSPRRQIALAIIGCSLVAMCWFVATSNFDAFHRWVAWFGVPVFALCVVVALKRLLVGGVPFVFELAGIAFPTGSFGLLPWAEIKNYKVVTVRRSPFLAFEFHDPDRVLSRVSSAKRRWAKANQRLGWGHWALSFTGVTPGMSEAIAFIGEHSLLPQTG